MQFAVEIDKKTYAIDLPGSLSCESWVAVSIDQKPYHLNLDRKHGVVILRDDQGVEQLLRVRRSYRERFDGESATKVQLEMLATGGEGMQKATVSFCPNIPGQAQRAKKAGEQDLVLRSQITGKVLSVDVKTGQTVEQGQPLAIIEAMKMENRIFAPAAGTILSVSIKAGDNITTGKEMFKVKRSKES